MADIKFKEIDPKRIVILRKRSRLETYMLSEQASFEDAKNYYLHTAHGDRVVDSYQRQIKSFELVKASLNNPQVFVGDDINKEALKNAQLVLVVGGDGYFTYVSHLIDSQLVIGINSDPHTSIGALLSFDASGFVQFKDELFTGQFNIDEWSRMQLSIDGTVIQPLALADIFIGAKYNTDISRFVLEYHDQKEEQRGSGIVVSTGTGSTGWYNKVFLTHFLKPDTFSKDSPYFKYIVRESVCVIGDDTHTGGCALISGQIDKSETLTITSLMEDGVISPDSHSSLMFSFKRGQVAQIKLSDKPLLVVNK